MPLVIPLALIDLGNGRGGIVREDGEVVAKGRIAIIVPQAKAHEANQFRTLDGIIRSLREDLREDVSKLFAKVHSIRMERGGLPGAGCRRRTSLVKMECVIWKIEAQPSGSETASLSRMLALVSGAAVEGEIARGIDEAHV